ncbi:MAG: hypothetical protein R2862_10140 [Thermoanaerobaculia bacterium]
MASIGPPAPADQTARRPSTEKAGWQPPSDGCSTMPLSGLQSEKVGVLPVATRPPGAINQPSPVGPMRARSFSSPVERVRRRVEPSPSR